jgi:hypothetical protein
MNSKRLTSTTSTLAAAIIAISLLTTTILMSPPYSTSAYAQNQKTNQSQTNKTKNAAPPIGNVQQLSQALGNNSKILANNTNIGNPNAGKAASLQQKVTSGTPTNSLPSNPTKGPTKAGSGGGASQNKTSGGTSNMTNTTASTAKSPNSTTTKK